jgi:hypothetical protein
VTELTELIQRARRGDADADQAAFELLQRICGGLRGRA